MTDLTRGWRDIYVTSNTGKLDMLTKVMALNPEIVRNFVRVDIADSRDPLYEEILWQKKDIAEKTAEKAIRLPSMAAISAIFQSFGGLRLIISDMGGVVLDRNVSYEDLYKYNFDTVSAVNDWVEDAQKCARYLLR